jgi:uncharacterized caspase-like protein
LKRIILVLTAVLVLALAQYPVLADKPSWAGQGKSKGASAGVLGDLAAGEKYAIVIGISDYDHPSDIYDLQYASDDALSMNTTLIEDYGFPAANVFTFIDSSANKTDIVSAIDYIAGEANAGDEVVFFFSGVGGRHFGLPDADGDAEEVDEFLETHDGAYLFDGELRDLFSAYDTSRIIFILDCTYSGGYDDLAAPGRIICTATNENGFAFEEAELGHGEFTYYFVVEGLAAGGADVDANSDSVITIEEAYDYAKSIKATRLNKAQIYDQFVNDLLL